jgi:putative iron-regulated protein
MFQIGQSHHHTKKKIVIPALVAGLAAVLGTGCSDSDDNSGGGQATTDWAAVQTAYLDLGHDMYSDAYDAVVEMETAIDAFLAAPSETTLMAAREAWLEARETYGPTEAWRGWAGPIEFEDANNDGGELEGLINAWPLDEAYLDYVVGDADAGLINDTDTAITVESLLGANGQNDDEAAVTVGWHAIEFLLWGQDLDPAGPGARAATDFDALPQLRQAPIANANMLGSVVAAFTVAPGATGEETTIACRRSEALDLMVDLLKDHIVQVRDAWDDSIDGSFAATVGDTYDGEAMAGWIVTGIKFMADDELAIERMSVAMDIAEEADETTPTAPRGGNAGDNGLRSQELEHSCFSDNTHRDIYLNAAGIRNIYLGTWAGDSLGSDSLYAVHGDLNSTQAAATKAALDAAVEACEAISDLATGTNPVPFDNQVLVGEAGDRATVQAAIDALVEAGEQLALAAEDLGLSLDTGFPGS